MSAVSVSTIRCTLNQFVPLIDKGPLGSSVPGFQDLCLLGFGIIADNLMELLRSTGVHTGLSGDLKVALGVSVCE